MIGLWDKRTVPLSHTLPCDIIVRVIIMEEIKALSSAVDLLVGNDVESAAAVIQREIPFVPTKNTGRHYSTAQKIAVFARDHFIDRYSGEKLLNPGLLRAVSRLCPGAFPFQTNWRMDACHPSIWRLTPTIDHVVPVARGGNDNEGNWITTNMIHNSAKANWTLEELGWKLYPESECPMWDGLSKQFLAIYAANETLHTDAYIRDWHRATVKIYG